MINNFLNESYAWLVGNWQSIVFLIIGVGIIYAIYKLLSREINRLKNQEKIDENIAFNLNRLFKWISILAVLGVIVTQFVVDLSPVIGFMALAGGTIIGFASMNTIGNAIAGIIVTLSKPFQIGDRILFNEEFADVVAIDLIYTRMKTLDNVLISIPNQQLLTTKIDNYGKKRIVRRACTITAGYDVSSEKIEKLLIESANRVEGVLKEPKPYVLVTNLLNFAVEYSLYVFTNQIKKLRTIDSNLKRTVLEVCEKNGIDLTTPNLIQSVGGKNNAILSE
jgi:small-conductance mechanosensitive channel